MLRCTASLSLAFLLLGQTAPAFALSIVDPGQGVVALADAAGTLPRELSGLAFDPASGHFHAVSDDDTRLQRLAIDVDPATGHITRAVTLGTLPLTGADGSPLPPGRDLEGVALSGSGSSVFVSDETGPAIREHALADGRLLREIGPASAPALAIYASQRVNLGFEAIAVAPGGSALWVSNEEALLPDGPAGTGNTATLVRLQRLDAALAPDGQFAYRVDGDTVAGAIGNVNSGVSELLALPGGGLLVLERAAGLVSFAPDIDLRNRIYLVDTELATDVTGVPALASASFTVASKTLLWEGAFPDHNFEGMALGPLLDGGDRSLILVADDGSGLSPGLYALRLTGLVPEPGTASLLGMGLALLAGLSRRRGPARRARCAAGPSGGARGGAPAAPDRARRVRHRPA